jgi:hypothetical protein
MSLNTLWESPKNRKKNLRVVWNCSSLHIMPAANFRYFSDTNMGGSMSLGALFPLPVLILLSFAVI